MDVKAIIKGVRISPIKLRLTADMIRGKTANEALNIVNNYNSKPSRILKKALDSAIANAVNNNKMDTNKLYVKEIRIDMGQTLKRNVPGSRGSIDKNYHRSSHVTIILNEKEDKSKKVEAKVEEPKAPKKAPAKKK